jgi:hypothetical protein
MGRATPFTIPPLPTRSIGDVLVDANVSFRWCGEGCNQYKASPNDPPNGYQRPISMNPVGENALPGSLLDRLTGNERAPCSAFFAGRRRSL